MTGTNTGNKNSTLENFDFQALLYDTYQTHCIPRYEEMNAVAAGFLAHVLSRTESPRILDMGCGTGNTSLAVMQRIPGATVTCIDGSEEMLHQARVKLGDRGSHDDWRVADLSAPGWNEPFGEGIFDGVISVLVLEHLPFDAYKAVINRVCRLLKPQGWFVAVEAYEGALTHELFAREMARWEQRAVANAIITPAQLQQIKETSSQKEKHYFSTLEDKKRWWIDAGLEDVQFIWQYYCAAILVGTTRTADSAGD
ncbi:MAG: class I SAM-dependent methyltransferase [Thermodesulfobacteriota bacterium]